jgi:hypothetical protein
MTLLAARTAGGGRIPGRWCRAARRRSLPVTAATVLACTVAGCTAAAPAPIPHAPVTTAQRDAISRYYDRHVLPGLGLGPPHPGYSSVACPVDVLGAARTGQRLRVYTVIHCTTCGIDSEATQGLTADLIGTTVTGIQQDNAEDYSGMIAEASIYPPSIRPAALADINTAGPAWLRNLAAKDAGCPHGPPAAASTRAGTRHSG